MSIATKLTALILAVSVGAVAPTPEPRCIERLITSESGVRPRITAPSVTPSRGDAGTTVRISGAGFTAGDRLTIAAVYAENDCVIQGLGDEFLGSTRADVLGAYSFSIRWPARFDPVLGRNEMARSALPNGRYYVFALPCAARAACSFTAGTKPGGPFVLGETRAPPRTWIAVAIGLLLVTGVALVRRRLR